MSKRLIKDEADLIVEEVITAMQDKKAKSIISMNLSNIPNAVTKYFVICHAPSKTQVGAISDNVVDKVREKCDAKPFNREGHENSEWILIDYVDVVAHIFLEDVRTFYHLEDLWADAEIKKHKSDT